MKMKKFTVILAALMLVASVLTACGTTDTTGKETTATIQTEQSVPTETSAQTDDTISKTSTKEKITLTMLSQSVGIFENGVQTDPVAKEIERVTGVTLDIVNINGESYQTKFTASLASDDLPDLVFIPTNHFAGNLKMLQNGDKIVDLTELMKTYGNSFTKNPILNYAVQLHQKFDTTENKLYVAPLCVGGQAGVGNPTVGPYIRWDYFKEIGYPEINTLDDWLNALEKIQKNHPTAANNKKAYAVSFWTDWGTWPVSSAPMMDGFTNTSVLQVDISNDKNPTAFYTDKNSEFWKWEKFYFNAKQKGLLDPDALTQKWDQWVAKITSGQVYSMLPGWISNNLYNNQEAPEQGFAVVNYAPSSNKYDANYGVAAGQDAFAITKKCKYPERAMELLNYFASNEGIRTIQNGVRGQTWDVVNGKPEFLKNILDELNTPAGKETGYLAKKYGAQKFNHLAGLTGTEMGKDYDATYYIMNDPSFMVKNLTAYEKDCATHYGVTIPGDLYSKKEFSGYLGAPASVMPVATTEIKKIEDKVNAYVNIGWLTMILSKDEADFNANQDKFIKDLNDMGHQKLFDWYKTNWEKVSTTLDSFEK